MEQNISKDVQERLKNINWESLKAKYGISQESVMQTPGVASQLAYGQYTDLVPGSTEEINGMFSLRAYPQGEGEQWKVKVYTMEKEKSEKDQIFIYGHPVTSDYIKKALFERTTWQGSDGQTKRGYANANAGRPIALEMDGRRQEFLLSIHQPTNRVVAMPVDQVRLFFQDRDGASRGKSMYGVQFTDDQIKYLCEGKAVRLDGCQTKNGETFNCYVQFDAAARQVVSCHPAWLKEAQKTGTDLGLGREKAPAQEQARQETAEAAQAKKPSQGPRVR